MGFTVVTMERQTGAGAENVAALVAAGLHYQLLDAEIVRRAAAAAGVSTETIEHSERIPSFFERILSGLALAGSPDTSTDPAQLAMPTLSNRQYRELTEQVLRGLASRGRVVILGHGGQVTLQQVPEVLKVLVHAPLEFRVSNFVVEAQMGPEEARKKIESADGDRERFFGRHYRVRWLDPQLYDLAINTSTFSHEEAAKVIIDAAGTQEEETPSRSARSS
jgi:cytidylate kinase